MQSGWHGVLYVVTNDPVPDGKAVLAYRNDGEGNLSPLPGSPFRTGTGYATRLHTKSRSKPPCTS
jgi:hypothetical protein